MNLIKYILLLLAGADPEGLADADNKERRAYYWLGLAALIPATAGILGMYYQAEWFGFTGYKRCFVCLLYFAAILVIDVSLITAMRRPKEFDLGIDTGKYIAKIAARLSIAITIGYFISQPLIIRHYRAEVDEQLEIMRKEKLDSVKAHTRQQFAQLAFTDSATIKQKTAEVKCLEVLLNFESQGKDTLMDCGKAKGERGMGPEYKSHEARLKQARKEVATLDSIINAKRLERDSSAQALYNYINLHYRDGYDIREQAVVRIKASSTAATFRHNLLIVILILFDVMALLIKLLMDYGNLDKYLKNFDSDTDNLFGVKAKFSDAIRDAKINCIDSFLNHPTLTAGSYNTLLNQIKLKVDGIHAVFAYKSNSMYTPRPKWVPDIVFPPIERRNRIPIEATLGFCMLMLIVYNFDFNNWQWFSTWGTLVSMLYTAVLSIYKDLNNR